MGWSEISPVTGKVAGGWGWVIGRERERRECDVCVFYKRNEINKYIYLEFRVKRSRGTNLSILEL